MTYSLRPRLPWLAVGLLSAILVVSLSQFAAAQTIPKNFVIHAAPKPVAAFSFMDSNEKLRSLADFKNHVVLLNIWATWCVPCRHEMPALDRLQTTLGGTDFEVLAVSIDRGGKDVVTKFFGEVGIQKLGMYLDSAGKAMRELGVFGLPTTLLLDREGREIGRLIGPAEWDSPEIVQFIRCVISRNKMTQSSKDPKSATVQSCTDQSHDGPTSTPPGNDKT